MLANRKTIRIIQNSLRQGVLGLLVLLYSAAAFKVDSLHGLFHVEELERLHSAEQEKNPCHRAIFHFQTEAGCEHPTHLTESTKCHLCEFNFTPDQWHPTFQLELLIVNGYYFLEAQEQDILTEPRTFLRGRAPPVA